MTLHKSTALLLIFYISIITICSCLSNGTRSASLPYITGDGFRAHADFIFDETQQSLNPQDVFEKSILFVKTDMLDQFLTTIHPNINHRYILITHNSDGTIPGKWHTILDDDRIIAWFGQNVEGYTHPKLHPIPIGIANTYVAHGNPLVFHKLQKQIPHYRKEQMLYMNFSLSTYPTERNYVYRLFKNRSYCVVDNPHALEQYLTQLIRSRFVLSPRGNGPDCHRTWEALLMGAIPIVKHSSLDPLFENLPVLIVNEWQDISEALLIKTYTRYHNTTYNLDKLYLNYWIDLIDSYRQE